MHIRPFFFQFLTAGYFRVTSILCG